MNQLPVGKEDFLDSVSPHNLESEHHFGEFTQRLQCIGSQHVNHVSECMTISSNSDLAFKDHGWKSKDFKKIYDELQKCKNKFEKEQDQLRKKNVEVEDLNNVLEEGRKKAGLLEKMKSHGGPITSRDDIDNILAKFDGWEKYEEKSAKTKKLKSILRQNGRDHFFTTVKKTNNPLFKVNNLSVSDMVENLRVLHGNYGENITADMEDIRTALSKINSKSTEDTAIVTEKENAENTIVPIFNKEESILFQVNGSFGLGIIEEVHPQELWVIALENSGVKNSLESVGKLWKYPDN